MDFSESLDAQHLAHAAACLNHPDPAIRAAFLTGTVVGVAQGKSIYGAALDDYATARAADFGKYLGPPPPDLFHQRLNLSDPTAEHRHAA